MWAEVYGGCVSYIMNFVPRKFDLEHEAKYSCFSKLKFERKREKNAEKEPIKASSKYTTPFFLAGITKKT